MYRSTRQSLGVLFVGVCAALLGACTPDSVTTPDPERPLLSVNIASGPVGSGNFTNAIVPTNDGRGSGAFWDNHSADEGAATQCNIGYFAVGTMSLDCANETFGSTANQGGFAGGTYLGSGSGDRGPSDFMFNVGSYSVKLVGSYAGGTSTVGWFTKNGSYNFHPVLNWSNKVIGHTEIVDGVATGNRKWGFYIQNSSIIATGSCNLGNQSSCSDATGGFTTSPYNQFALMKNLSGSQFLVGAEDNVLELLGSNPDFYYRDSDYNDYIFLITPAVTGAGCTYTQGYWKTHGPSAKGKNANVWPVTSLTLGTRSYSASELQNILNTAVKGNGLISMAHQLIAAKLNIANGASAPSSVLQGITDADALIGSLVIPPVGTGSLSPSATSSLVGVLGGYNEGDTGPGHCGSEQVVAISF